MLRPTASYTSVCVDSGAKKPVNSNAFATAAVLFELLLLLVIRLQSAQAQHSEAYGLDPTMRLLQQ
jgi:hypothetical protein